MNITLSIDGEIVQEAMRAAEALGTSVKVPVRNYLEQLAVRSGPTADSAELQRLSLAANGNSRGWKFDRNELHERA